MKQKVLITGGSGLLALNWALSMRDKFDVCLGLHDRVIQLNGIGTCKMDLESNEDIQRIIDDIEPQIIIHTAGITNVELCEHEPNKARHVNVELARNIANACEKNGLKIVHISTDHLFQGKEPFEKESNRTNPLNVYGNTKADAEASILAICSKALIVRTNFYGWGTSYRRSFSDEIIKSLNAGHELILFKDVFYTPILIEILANTTQELININANGIYHVVGDERISKYEFGLKVAKQFELDSYLIKPGFLSDKQDFVQRPLDMSLSNRKVCGTLGRALGNIEDHLKLLKQQKSSHIYRELNSL